MEQMIWYLSIDHELNAKTCDPKTENSLIVLASTIVVAMVLTLSTEGPK